MSDEDPNKQIPRIFVGGMAHGRDPQKPVTEEMIRMVFSKFGEIVGIKTGMKDFVFIDYKDHESCQQAIETMHQKPFDEDSSGPMKVQYAEPRRERRADARRFERRSRSPGGRGNFVRRPTPPMERPRMPEGFPQDRPRHYDDFPPEREWMDRPRSRSRSRSGRFEPRNDYNRPLRSRSRSPGPPQAYNDRYMDRRHHEHHAPYRNGGDHGYNRDMPRDPTMRHPGNMRGPERDFGRQPMNDGRYPNQGRGMPDRGYDRPAPRDAYNAGREDRYEQRQPYPRDERYDRVMPRRDQRPNGGQNVQGGFDPRAAREFDNPRNEPFRGNPRRPPSPARQPAGGRSRSQEREPIDNTSVRRDDYGQYDMRGGRDNAYDRGGDQNARYGMDRPEGKPYDQGNRGGRPEPENFSQRYDQQQSGAGEMRGYGRDGPMDKFATSYGNGPNEDDRGLPPHEKSRRRQREERFSSSNAGDQDAPRDQGRAAAAPDFDDGDM